MGGKVMTDCCVALKLGQHYPDCHKAKHIFIQDPTGAYKNGETLICWRCGEYIIHEKHYHNPLQAKELNRRIAEWQDPQAADRFTAKLNEKQTITPLQKS